ncbi:MAG: hypothetical protein ACTS6H_01240 [Candidatus Hodgkinia cicadicola]
MSAVGLFSITRKTSLVRYAVRRRETSSPVQHAPPEVHIFHN